MYINKAVAGYLNQANIFELLSDKFINLWFLKTWKGISLNKVSANKFNLDIDYFPHNICSY